jgi:predicted lipoprotein with Yx(FWY)xxD motif
MNRLLIAAAAAVAAVVTLAACGGTSGNNSTGAQGSSTGSTTVSVERLGGAGVLVDSAGKALYANDQESGGKVLCTGACTSFWTPLTVSSGAPTESSTTGKLGVVERPDGTEQVTYNGKLLYSFSEDQPEQVTGDGFTDAFGGQQFTWHVIHAGSASSSSAAGTAAPAPARLATSIETLERLHASCGFLSWAERRGWAGALIAKALEGDVGALREAIHQLVGRPTEVVQGNPKRRSASSSSRYPLGCTHADLASVLHAWSQVEGRGIVNKGTHMSDIKNQVFVII